MFRVYIFIAVFLSGAALMSLEMAGLRLIQPEFGSDIIVYGSIISVFLGGLALGAFTGGKLSDRKPNVAFLGGILVVAGLATVLMPLYSDSVFTFFSPIQEGAGLSALELSLDDSGMIALYEPPDLRWVTLGVGISLFFIPSFLSGMISPYSARLLIRKLGRLGSGVGMLSALSTAGSIVGTLGSTFFLIQLLGTRRLILANGVLLIVLGALAFAVRVLARQEGSAVGEIDPAATV